MLLFTSYRSSRRSIIVSKVTPGSATNGGPGEVIYPSGGASAQFWGAEALFRDSVW